MDKARVKADASSCNSGVVIGSRRSICIFEHVLGAAGGDSVERVVDASERRVGWWILSTARLDKSYLRSAGERS